VKKKGRARRDKGKAMREIDAGEGFEQSDYRKV